MQEILQCKEWSDSNISKGEERCKTLASYATAHRALHGRSSTENETLFIGHVKPEGVCIDVVTSTSCHLLQHAREAMVTDELEASLTITAPQKSVWG